MGLDVCFRFDEPMAWDFIRAEILRCVNDIGMVLIEEEEWEGGPPTLCFNFVNEANLGYCRIKFLFFLKPQEWQITMQTTVHGFLSAYMGWEWDFAMRVEEVARCLHDSLGSSEVWVFDSDSADEVQDRWFHGVGGAWSAMEPKAVEECGEGCGGEASEIVGEGHWMRWLEAAGSSIVREGEAHFLRFGGRGREEAALVRNCLVCGCLLAEGSSEGEFLMPEGVEVERLRHVAWRSKGLVEVEGLLGAPEFRLPGIALDDSELEYGDLDVKGLAIYWDAMKGAAAVFREYVTGQVAVEFAGKRL